MNSFQLRNVHLFNADGVSDERPVQLNVHQGRIEGVAEELPHATGPVIDMQGHYASAGWIDGHAHVYFGATDIGLLPDEIGLCTGVHLVVDAGSAGEANFRGLHDLVIQASETDVLAYLNTGVIGLVAANRVSEYVKMELMDLGRMLEVAEQYRSVIRGIKVRVSGVIVDTMGMEVLEQAQQVAEAAKLPLVIHVGETPPELPQILRALEPGTLVTHCYHGKSTNSVLEAPYRRAMQEAAERGVLLDVGHGEASFSYAAADVCVQENILPFSISTDLHGRNRGGPVWDLPTTMTKMLHVGLSLRQVIDCVTANPAQFLGEPQRGEVRIGAEANLTLFSLADVRASVADSNGHERTLTKAVTPTAVVRKGVFQPLCSGSLAAPLYGGLLR